MIGSRLRLTAALKLNEENLWCTGEMMLVPIREA